MWTWRYGQEKALTRGGEGAIEGALLTFLPTVFLGGIRTTNEEISDTVSTAHQRFTNATLGLLPRGAYTGATVSGLYEFVTRADPDFQDYLLHLGAGAGIGAGVVLAPYLLYLGQRYNLYKNSGGVIKKGAEKTWEGMGKSYEYLSPKIGHAAAATGKGLWKGTKYTASKVRQGTSWTLDILDDGAYNGGRLVKRGGKHIQRCP